MNLAKLKKGIFQGGIGSCCELVSERIHGLSSDWVMAYKRDFCRTYRLSESEVILGPLMQRWWDVFVDWLVFKRGVLRQQLEAEAALGFLFKTQQHGLFWVKGVTDEGGYFLKGLLDRKSYFVVNGKELGVLLVKGDLIEARVFKAEEKKQKRWWGWLTQEFYFFRMPLVIPYRAHSYIENKVRFFRRGQVLGGDVWEEWLWEVVAMVFKHHLYPTVEVEHIFDDDSRI